MKIFSNEWSFYPRRVQIYLAEKGLADIDYEHVDMLAGANKSDDFLALNPCGSLSTLQADAETTIRQSMAIIFYLEDLHPEPDMLGATPIDRARMQELIWLINDTYLYRMNDVAQRSPLFEGVQTQSPEAAEAFRARYLMGMEQLETLASDGPFLTGPSVTIADCMMFAMEQYIRELFGPRLPGGCTKLNRWYETFSQRPSADLPDYPPAIKESAALSDR